MNVFPHWLRRFQKREVGEAAPGRCCPRQTSRDHRWRACPDGHRNAPSEAPRNLTHPQVDWACLVGQRFFGIDYCFRFIHNGFQWKGSCTHHSMVKGERGGTKGRQGSPAPQAEETACTSLLHASAADAQGSEGRSTDNIESCKE